MLVSVIMACYNEEKTIKVAIDSILNQTFQDFEIIIVDNGSKDATMDIVNNSIKKDSRIKLYECSIKGPAAARNLAVTKTSGEYIVNMDADDVSDKTRLEKLLKICREHKKCIVGSNIEYVNEKEVCVRASNFPLSNEEIRKGFKRLHNRSVMMAQTVMATKCIFEQFKYNENFTYLEDWDFILRAASDKEIVFKNHEEYLYKYKLKPNSVTFNCYLRSRYNLLIWFNQYRRYKKMEEIYTIEEFNVFLGKNIFWAIIFYIFYAMKLIQHSFWTRRIKMLLAKS